jgi:hypothetical protein
MENTHSALVHLKRTWAWSGAARNLNVIIDGAKVGVISNGQEGIYMVQPGTHSLSLGAPLLFMTSDTMTFDLKANETINLI